ncbi:hypothetical protein ABID28_000037 [Streptococcus porcorum]|uniref:Uncharacterized protein n=1 Tax=Streptococcus porcorum TaxID=701526 RepID=A0ABV2JC94_9STRE
MSVTVITLPSESVAVAVTLTVTPVPVPVNPATGLKVTSPVFGLTVYVPSPTTVLLVVPSSNE